MPDTSARPGATGLPVVQEIPHSAGRGADAVPDAVAQVDELSIPALSAYAELIAFLELTPWEGAPHRDDKPDGNMRTVHGLDLP